MLLPKKKWHLRKQTWDPLVVTKTPQFFDVILTKMNVLTNVL